MLDKVKAVIHSENFVQLIKYGLIGILGLIVDLGIYTTLTYFKLNVEISNIISSSCGLINNFFWNSFTNFKVHDRILLRFISYVIVGQATTLFIFVTKIGYPHLFVNVLC